MRAGSVDRRGRVAQAVLDAARGLRLSVYDAAYLDLARFRDVPIATLDGDLTRACQASGVRLVS